MFDLRGSAFNCKMIKLPANTMTEWQMETKEQDKERESEIRRLINES